MSVEAIPRPGLLTADDWISAAIQQIKLGDIVTGVYACRRALALDPSRADVWMSLIFCLDLHPTASELVRRSVRAAFDREIIRPTPKPFGFGPRLDPDKRLRIGYVSADFGCHSAAVGFGNSILGADPANVEQYLYSARIEPADPITEVFREKADRWTIIHGLADEIVAEQIYEDEIDVLVDLAGYSAGNRIQVFARRPAPIQITGWGHGTGTDLSCFDYTVSDRMTTPPELVRGDRETVIYLPCILGYVASEAYPIETPDDDDPITFGYLGRGGKLSASCLSAWADILHQVPGSRLLLKDALWETPEGRARILVQMVALGISTDRIVFRGSTTHEPHLATYNEVDVHLDSFPHGGGITTLDASWMGCPTVTLLGDTEPGRAAGSILTTLGYEDRITHSRDEYVSKAITLAHLFRHGLDTVYREDMRQRMVVSPILDRRAYASAVERGYRAAWRRWCDGVTR